MHTKYNHLTDDELLNLAQTTLDPLTCTDLERELLARFEYVAPLLNALNEFGYDDPEALKQDLQHLADIRA